MTRDAIIEVIYKSVEHRAPFTLAQFGQALHGWDVLPLEENGELIGGVLSKGNELHVGYAKQPRASIRPYIRAILGAALEKHGTVLTSIQSENIVGLRFCERLGFVKIHEEGGTIRLRCDRSTYL